MASSFADLDELVLTCRDHKAKGYIAEAVASYRSGAYRAAIVSTWIAICFDVIEKIRELALAGDQQAELLAKEIEETRVKNDFSKALKFEREILVIARDKFELISPVEYIDLQRIQEDRNRCAHPSLASEEQIFSPSAELARLHIRSAVSHLLAHPPAQGKYALNRLLSEINSEYFPQEVDKAHIAFLNSPLKKPRESLVRNLIIVLLKDLLKNGIEWKQTRRIRAAISAIKSLHPEWYQVTLKDKASQVLGSLKDDELEKIEFFFKCVEDVWHHLDAGIQQRCKSFVSNLPKKNVDDMDFYLSFTPLQKSAEQRAITYTAEDYEDALFFDLPSVIANKFIKSYLTASSFDNANSWSKLIATYAGDFNATQIIEVIANISKNDQITGSFELPMLLKRLKSTKKLDDEEFDGYLKSNGLAKYVLKQPIQEETNIEEFPD